MQQFIKIYCPQDLRIVGINKNFLKEESDSAFWMLPGGKMLNKAEPEHPRLRLVWAGPNLAARQEF